MAKEIGVEYISLLDKEKAVAKYLWRIVIIQAVVIVVLAISFLTIKETARVKVELPAKFIYKNTPVVLAGVKGANEMYYKMWAEYLIKEISNFTPENIGNKILIIKKAMRPSVLTLKEKKIDEFVDNLVLNLINQNYKIKNIKKTIWKKDKDLFSKMSLKIEGIAKQKIGEMKKIENKECAYTIDFRYLEGAIYVEDFGTNCF